MIKPSLAIAALLAGLVPAAAHADAASISWHHVRVPADAPMTRIRAPLARVEAANSSAAQQPGSAGHVGAAQVYAWVEGGVYRLYAAPGLVSDIALQPGEGLISVAAGDTVRWVIGDTTSGSGASKRTHILVKPASAGLRTNLVITTDRRVYLMQIESNAGPAIAAVSWSYPQDELLALKRAEESARAAEPAATDVAVERLNFNYAIEGDQPAWRPIRAFDDGTQVFIEFPPSLASGEAPPLFVVGASGKAELVNYRLCGRYYVVDKLFSAAELRLGEKRQQVVRIIRSNAARRGRAS